MCMRISELKMALISVEDQLELLPLEKFYESRMEVFWIP